MLGNRSRSQSQLLSFENLGILRCVLFLLWVLSLFLFLTLSLFLSPFIAFEVDIILTVIVEYFWDLHCLAVWLFGCCVLLLFIAFGICSCVYFTFVYQGPQY